MISVLPLWELMATDELPTLNTAVCWPLAEARIISAPAGKCDRYQLYTVSNESVVVETEPDVPNDEPLITAVARG